MAEREGAQGSSVCRESGKAGGRRRGGQATHRQPTDEAVGRAQAQDC